VVNNGAAANSPIVRTITLLANTAYTLSVFVKRRDYDTATVRIYTDETSFATCSFNLSTGTASGGSILNFGNGWYRVSVTLTTAATVTNSQVQLIRDAQIRNGVAGIYIWGAQLETGTVPTSYIPTTTGSVTRDADVISKTGVSGLIGQTEGTIYAEVDISSFVTGKRLVELSNGSAANRMVISVQGSLIQFLVQDASSTQATIDSATLSAGRFKVAAAYASNDFVFYVNGVKAGEDFIGTVPTLNQINIGSTWNSILQFNDRILSAAIYKTRLPNYLLESATSQIQSYSALASSLSYSIV